MVGIRAAGLSAPGSEGDSPGPLLASLTHSAVQRERRFFSYASHYGSTSAPASASGYSLGARVLSCLVPTASAASVPAESTSSRDARATKVITVDPREVEEQLRAGEAHNPYFLRKTFLNKELERTLRYPGGDAPRKDPDTVFVSPDDWDYHKSKFFPLLNAMRLRLENQRRRRHGLAPIPTEAERMRAAAPPVYLSAVIVEGNDIEESVALEACRRQREGLADLPPEHWARRRRQLKMEKMLAKVDTIIAEERAATEYDPLAHFKPLRETVRRLRERRQRSRAGRGAQAQDCKDGGSEKDKEAAARDKEAADAEADAYYYQSIACTNDNCFHPAFVPRY